MSQKEKKAATVYVLTHVVDWLINHDGKKHGLPQWKIEVLKVFATLAIVAVI